MKYRFPIVIIDEDWKAESASGLGIRALAKAIEELVSSADYANSFGRDGVPYVAGLETQDGIPLSTVNRTASLYGGNAALNPPSRGAI